MVPITQSIDTQDLCQHQPFLRAFSAMRKLHCGDVLCEDEYTFITRRNCAADQAA